MPTNNSFQPGPNNNELRNNEGFNLTKFIMLMVSKWYLFLISFILAFLISYIFINLSIPKYQVSASLLIDPKEQEVSLGEGNLLEGFSLGTGTKNLDNQIMIISSRNLVGKTLDDLDYYFEYFQRNILDKKSIYPDKPIRIVPEDSVPENVVFSIKPLNENFFTLDCESIDTIEFKNQYSYGEQIDFSGGSFTVEIEDTNWFNTNNKRTLYFTRHKKEDLIDTYVNRLKVSQASRLGTILKISLVGTNRSMDKDFIDKLMEIFLISSLDKKNLEAVRTIAFIDDQLIGISDSLIITENKLQEFRSRNKVMNLSAQGQVIIDQAMKLENDRARIEIEANYYDYLNNYLSKENTGEVPIAPATMGITDPGLTKLVQDLAELHGQLYSKSLGDKNPLQNQLILRIRNIREALQETLRGVRNANNLARNENLEQIRTINAQATALPVTERQLLGIEREFKLNDALYTFLLEKRAVAQIQKASNLPDNEIIDEAKADNLPVKPKKSFIYFLAIIAASSLPLMWILITNSLDNKIRDEEDIKEITNIPVVGYLPTNLNKKETVVLNELDAHNVEAFRSIRSRMQFLTKDALAPTILVTSSMAYEGKTYTAINLASVYSLLGKKTVIVDYDLRRPRIHTYFDLMNNKGVSTWLIGKDGLQDILKETQFENLYVIPAGQIPPNPSELIPLEKTRELLSQLKERFEFIIIDTSPLGPVSDALPLLSMADTSILVTRYNMTQKEVLGNTINELKYTDIKSISIILNDLNPRFTKYNNELKYNYNYANRKKDG